LATFTTSLTVKLAVKKLHVACVRRRLRCSDGPQKSFVIQPCRQRRLSGRTGVDRRSAQFLFAAAAAKSIHLSILGSAAGDGRPPPLTHNNPGLNAAATAVAIQLPGGAPWRAE